MSDASNRSPLSPDTALARGASVVGRFLKSRAAVAQSYHPSCTLNPPHSTQPITMTDASSLSSSPSLYSRRGSHVSSQARGVVLPGPKGLGVFADSDYESEEEDFSTQRLSMVSGPRVRRYADNPWGDDEDVDQSFMAGSHPKGFSRMIQAAKTRTNSTPNTTSPTGSTMTATSAGRVDASGRRAMALFSKSKQLFPSTSGGSLASSQTISTATSEHVVTPKLKSPFGGPTSPPLNNLHPSQSAELGDHGHMSRDVSEETLLPIANATVHSDRAIFDMGSLHGDPSAFPIPGANSPGFGLISLEQAQDREKIKNHKRTGTAHRIVAVKSSSKVSSTSSRDSRSPHHDDTAPHRAISNASTSSPLPPPNRVKPKKSGIMKMFTKDKSTNNSEIAVPKLPTPPLASSLRAAPHPTMPVKARPSIDGSMGDASSTRGSTYTHSAHSNATSPMLDKPLPLPNRSPPKKEKKDKRMNDLARGPTLLGEELQKPRLELRPISMNFSNGFASDYLSAFGDTTSSGASSPTKSAGPVTPSEASFSFNGQDSDEADKFKESLSNARKGWRLQQFELEAQIRDLQLQLEDAKKPKAGGCEACGCTCGGKLSSGGSMHGGGSVMDRARAKTGGPRGVFGSGSLYE